MSGAASASCYNGPFPSLTSRRVPAMEPELSCTGLRNHPRTVRCDTPYDDGLHSASDDTDKTLSSNNRLQQVTSQLLFYPQSHIAAAGSFKTPPFLDLDSKSNVKYRTQRIPKYRSFRFSSFCLLRPLSVSSVFPRRSACSW